LGFAGNFSSFSLLQENKINKKKTIKTILLIISDINVS